MTNIHSYLCIGGALDGKRHYPQNEARFSVPVLQEVSASISDMEIAPDSANVSVCEYREDVIHTPQGDVFFFIPTKQTPLETLGLLLRAYARKSVDQMKPRLRVVAPSRQSQRDAGQEY